MLLLVQTGSDPTLVGFTPDLSNGIFFSGAGLSGWDGISSLGPIPVDYLGSGFPLDTNRGELTLSNIDLDFTADTQTPEPASYALAGVGAAALALSRWRRRRTG